MKLLHFADAHIDMANYGKHDPETGLPLRVLDFLRALDTIVDRPSRKKWTWSSSQEMRTKTARPHRPFNVSGENALSGYLVQKSQLYYS